MMPGVSVAALRTRLTPAATPSASDAVDAELCIYVDGNLTESATSDPALVVPVFGRLRGHLVLTRAGRAFDDGERDRIELIPGPSACSNPAPAQSPCLTDSSFSRSWPRP